MSKKKKNSLGVPWTEAAERRASANQIIRRQIPGGLGFASKAQKVKDSSAKALFVSHRTGPGPLMEPGEVGNAIS